MTPGRFRTRSAPFRLDMLSLSYVLFLAISFLRLSAVQYNHPCRRALFLFYRIFPAFASAVAPPFYRVLQKP